MPVLVRPSLAPLESSWSRGLGRRSQANPLTIALFLRRPPLPPGIFERSRPSFVRARHSNQLAIASRLRASFFKLDPPALESACAVWRDRPS